MIINQAGETTLRTSMELICDPRNLDASVSEVFETMLGLRCERETGAGHSECEVDSLTAVVGFGGSFSGACIVRCDDRTAERIASVLTGVDIGAIDDTVKDAIGELCNMLAGAWKSNIHVLGADCGLSVPAVISGRDYHLHIQSPEFRVQHRYSSGSIRFEMTIVCDSLR